MGCNRLQWVKIVTIISVGYNYSGYNGELQITAGYTDLNRFQKVAIICYNKLL